MKMSSKRFNNTNEDFAGFSEADFEEVIQLSDTAVSANTDFLATISPPVVSQPQAFTDGMLDPASRGLMAEIPLTHTNGADLQRKLRERANQLQSTIRGQFAVNKGSMGYKELLAGLILEGENFQALNNFTFMNYTSLQFCDDSGITVSQRNGGICLLTNKRILFLSSQLAVYTSLTQRGNPKTLPGGYTIKSSRKDTTYYLPIPLSCLRSVEMAGETGVTGKVTVDGVEPCCFGLCEFLALTCCPDSDMVTQWTAQPIGRSQVQDMRVTVGLLMPPWERKMFVHINMDQNVPLSITRDFVALLQKNSPALR